MSILTHRVRILVLKDTAQQQQQLEKNTKHVLKISKTSYFFLSKILRKQLMLTKGIQKKADVEHYQIPRYSNEYEGWNE